MLIQRTQNKTLSEQSLMDMAVMELKGKYD
jgi:hypothetical protein